MPPASNPPAGDERLSDRIGNRPLSARSVLATALLGADQPRLAVGQLVAMASLFGISAGAARTCLWRMVSNGELASDNGTYALAGHLLERR
ncbi:MAG: PaaX family transcriptional regulator C-terminal domain-containing protein, partial [Mycobacterium sp.]